MTQTTIHHY